MAAAEPEETLPPALRLYVPPDTTRETLSLPAEAPTPEQQTRIALRRAEAVPTDAYNQARQNGQPGVSAELQARAPEVFTPSIVDQNQKLLDERPALRELVVEKDPTALETMFPNFTRWAKTWDSALHLAPEIGEATSDELKKTWLMNRNGWRGTSLMFDVLSGSPENPNTRRHAEQAMDQMNALTANTQALPRALQFIPKGVGQMPNAAGAIVARGLGLAAGVGVGTLIAGGGTVATEGAGAPAAIPAGASTGAAVGQATSLALEIGFTGTLEGGNWYLEYTREHPDDDKRLAAAGGLLVGLVNGALEIIPADVALDTMSGQAKREMTKLLADKAFRDVALHGLSRWATGVTAETLTEAAQEVMPAILDAVEPWMNGKISAKEMYDQIISATTGKRILAAGLEGGEASILAGGVTTVIGGVRAKAEAERAKEMRSRFQQIAETSKADADLIQAAPDRYTQLVNEAVADGGEIDSVYVEPAKLREAYKNNPTGFDALLEKVPGLREGLELAEATGTSEAPAKVRIPAGEFATYIAGAQEFDALGDHLSFREDQKSLSETRAQESEANLNELIAKMNALRASSEVDPITARQNEADFRTNVEALIRENAPAAGARSTEKASGIFARMVSRISEMSGKDPLEYMVSVLDRLKVEQRQNLDTPEEQARTAAFGTDRFQATRPADAQFEIYDRKTGAVVGYAKTRRGAGNAVDRRDNAYGAYRYNYRPVQGSDQTNTQTTPGQEPNPEAGTTQESQPADTYKQTATPNEIAQQVPGYGRILPFLTPEEAERVSETQAQRIVDAFEGLPSAEEIASVGYAGKAKRGWYRRSAQAIVDIFGIRDAPRFTALLAAFSPQTSVESNLINALKIWTAWVREGRPTDQATIRRIFGENVQGDKGEQSVLGAWIPNGIKSLTAEDPASIVLSGAKVNSFMSNLRDAVNEVTIDAWELLVFGVADAGDLTRYRVKTNETDPGKALLYLAISARVREAARIATERTGIEWTPEEIQETTWSWAKALLEMSQENGETRTPPEIISQGGLTDARIADTPDFAVLFTEGVYREILAQGGIDVSAVGSRESRAGSDGGGVALQGPGIADDAFQRDLVRAAERIQRTSEERARLNREAKAAAEARDAERSLAAGDPIGYLKEVVRGLRPVPGRGESIRAFESRGGRDGVGRKLAPTASGKAALEALGASAPTFEQVEPAKFLSAITEAAAKHKFGASVEVKSLEDYAREGMKLFLVADKLPQPNGKNKTVYTSGFAVTPEGDIVSAFNHPDAERGRAEPILMAAIQEGGWKLDCFDTVLPKIYARMGFVATGRIPWNEQYKPRGWNKKLFSKFNKGKPDVVFMRLELDKAHPYQPGEGASFESYDEAAQSQGQAADVYKSSEPTPGSTRGQLVVDRALKRFLLQISEENVNDATLIHELSHLALELVLDMAEDPNAAPDIKRYAGEVLSFLGAPDRASITGKMHERWAESWELYLREGKAPTEELQGLFSWFRARLLRIYETLRGRLVNADHDLSFVPLFDQLLATDHEIRAAAMRNDMVSGFADASALEGLTQAEQDEVVKLMRDAQEAERKALEAKIAREQDRVMKAQRSALREKIAAEVYARPEQRLRYWLIRGRLPDGSDLTALKVGKLSADAVSAIGGDVKRLPRGTWTREGGHSPADVAVAFGYDSPEEMLDALEGAEKPEALITRKVQEEAEQQGLVATPEELQAMAAEALAGPQRDRLYEAERRIAQRLKRAQGVTRRAEERATAGEQATTPKDARAALAAAQANLEEAIARRADKAELELLQTELVRARDAAEVARVARADQAQAARNARDLPSKLSTQMYRRAAARVVGATKVKDLKREVRSWAQRRARAARAKLTAMAKRDWDAYTAAVDAEQLANALYEVGSEALTDSQKQRRYMVELKRPGSKRRARLAKNATDEDGTNYLDVIDSLLAQVSFGQVSNKRLAYKSSIEAFAEKLASEKGINIPLPPWVTALIDAPSYREMTSEELADLYRAVRALEVHGLELAKDAETLAAQKEAAIRDELRAELNQRGPSLAALARQFEADESSKRKKWATQVLASMLSIETVADYIDNLNPEGPFNRYVVQPLQAAAQKEITLQKELARRMNAAWDQYSPVEKRQFYTHRIAMKTMGGEGFTKNAILAIAGQMGNEHGRNALRDGVPYGFTDAQLNEILSYVTDKDADFLIEVTSIIDSLWPEASAVQKRMNGEVAPKVEGSPWQLPSGRWMPGFYFPIQFNSDLRERAHELDEKKTAQGLFAFHGGSVMTKPAAMNARKKTSGTLTVKGDFMGIVTSHLDDMTKSIAWQETLVALDRRMKSLSGELTEKLGTSIYRTFHQTFVRLGAPERMTRNASWLNQWAGKARGGLGMLAMGWRVISAAIQLSGFLPSMHRVGGANILAGYRDVYLSGNPLTVIEGLREEIPDLRNRAETFDRDAQETMLRLNPVDPKHPLKSADIMRNYSMHYGYMMIGLADTFTASAVAAGAMRQALSGQVVGIEAGDREAAARYAGKIIRETQGSGAKVNLAPIMDGDEMQKMLTTMMTYNQTQLQQAILSGALAYEQRREARAGSAVPKVPHNKARFFAFATYTMLLAPILEEGIRYALQSSDGEPPDFEKWLANLMLKIGFGPLAGVPVVREAQGMWQGFGGGETPFATTLDVYYKLAKESNPASDNFDGEKMLRAWAEYGTYRFGAPTKQMVDGAEVLFQEPIGRGK